VSRERVHVDDGAERFVERYEPPAGEPWIVACAPHGGGIEPATDRQAAALADRLGTDAGAWLCRGYVDGGGAFERFHRPSTSLDRAAFALLGEALDAGYRHAVAFHGLGPNADAGSVPDGTDPGSGDDAVIVGGRAPRELRNRLRRTLADALPVPVVVATDGPYAGVDPQNVVNRLAAEGGLQVEQPPGVRDDHADAVVDAVAETLGDPG
jgi:phage replication-related protein YjqB (UPF0714/DUF867 family)